MHHMSTKTTIIGLVVLVIVLVGGYFIYKAMTPGTPAAQPAANQAATSTTQVQGQDVKVGTGETATPGMQVSVLYVGKLPDGTVFDSSALHGNQPLSFVLGAQGLIPGFQIGVNGMKVGGERLLAIPPALGYGSQDVKDASGKVIIPANSTLVFDVQLVNVSAASSTAATTTPAK
jgi:FKBP-type peptidyl-prolyl cis-trans isomerase